VKLVKIIFPISGAIDAQTRYAKTEIVPGFQSKDLRSSLALVRYEAIPLRTHMSASRVASLGYFVARRRPKNAMSARSDGAVSGGLKNNRAAHGLFSGLIHTFLPKSSTARAPRAANSR
jgi:hypothetical protein